MDATDPYAAKLQQQVDQYRDVDNIHELPAIFHYWAGRYLAPPLTELFGTADPVQIFTDGFAASVDAVTADRPADASDELPLFLSIGSGDCSIEVEIARRLQAAGVPGIIECTELSPGLIERGRKAAAAAGVTERLRFTQVDINHWQPQDHYHAVMAHHSLHHIVALEQVFDQVRARLLPGGQFVLADMIGRNGHMRWPEALGLMQAIWATLPESKRYNQQLRRLETEYVNWDCSGEGFEGIRAQDILPLLNERFECLRFMPFGNLTDVFIDRGFGHNYDAEAEADRSFIDRLHLINEALIDLGVLKPTMLIATLVPKGRATEPPRCYRDWQPAFCVRPVPPSPEALLQATAPPDPDSPPAADVASNPKVDQAAVAAPSTQPAQAPGASVQTAENAQLREALQEALTRRQQAEQQLAEVMSSTSWRLTAPLRALKTRLAAVRRA